MKSLAWLQRHNITWFNLVLGGAAALALCMSLTNLVMWTPSIHLFAQHWCQRHWHGKTAWKQAPVAQDTTINLLISLVGVGGRKWCTSNNCCRLQCMSPFQSDTLTAPAATLKTSHQPYCTLLSTIMHHLLKIYVFNYLGCRDEEIIWYWMLHMIFSLPPLNACMS